MSRAERRAEERIILERARRRPLRRLRRAAGVTLGIAAIALLLGACGRLSAALSGNSTVGAGITAAPVTPTARVLPGQTYRLKVRVYNTGSSAETFTTRAAHDSPPDGRLFMPVSWVRPTGKPVTIPAGKNRVLRFRLTVPAGAAPGRYTADIDAVLTLTPGHGGFSSAAGAETLIRFRVHPVTTAARITGGGR